jgi:hypothetical protein
MPLQKTFTLLYLLILAVALGAGIFAGAVTAPVVFHANDYIQGAYLNRYEMGSLMSEIFRRLAYIVDLSIAVIILEEVRKLLQKRKEWFGILMGVLAVISGYLFSFYFVPEILSMQQAGPQVTGSETFEALHADSELWFKIYILAIGTLLIKRIL